MTGSRRYAPLLPATGEDRPTGAGGDIDERRLQELGTGTILLADDDHALS